MKAGKKVRGIHGGGLTAEKGRAGTPVASRGADAGWLGFTPRILRLLEVGDVIAHIENGAG